MDWKNFLPFSGKLPVPGAALHNCHDLKQMWKLGIKKKWKGLFVDYNKKKRI